MQLVRAALRQNRTRGRRALPENNFPTRCNIIRYAYIFVRNDNNIITTTNDDNNNILLFVRVLSIIKYYINPRRQKFASS